MATTHEKLAAITQYVMYFSLHDLVSDEYLPAMHCVQY